MLYGSKAKKLSSNYCIKIDNNTIEQVVSTTFLGVVINQSLGLTILKLLSRKSIRALAYFTVLRSICPCLF